MSLIPNNIESFDVEEFKRHALDIIRNTKEVPVRIVKHGPPDPNKNVAHWVKLKK